MKAFSIGRDAGCDIVLQDPSDMISRRHAVLNISSTGKMTLVDQGRNGTYVNGIKIAPNVPFPVNRNDVVSFAHVMQLNWALVPNYAARFYAIVGGITVAIVVVGVIIGLLLWKCPEGGILPSDNTVAGVDSTATQPTDSVKTRPVDVQPKQPTDTVAQKTETPKTEKKQPENTEKKNPPVRPDSAVAPQPSTPARPLL